MCFPDEPWLALKFDKFLLDVSKKTINKMTKKVKVMQPH